MITNITITKMDISDILEVKELENSQNINILSVEAMKKDLKNINYIYFVAKQNNEIIGYIAISKVLDIVDILSIVVKQNYKREGIATTLLEYIFNLDNVSKIMLEVRKSNIVAQSLYEKLGFKKIHIRKNYYLDNHEDAYIYEKIIKVSPDCWDSYFQQFGL